MAADGQVEAGRLLFVIWRTRLTCGPTCHLNNTAFWLRAVCSGNVVEFTRNLPLSSRWRSLVCYLGNAKGCKAEWWLAACFASQGKWRDGGKWRGVQSQSEVTVVEISLSLREKVWRLGRKHVIENIPSDSCSKQFRVTSLPVSVQMYYVLVAFVCHIQQW